MENPNLLGPDKSDDYKSGYRAGINDSLRAYDDHLRAYLDAKLESVEGTGMSAEMLLVHVRSEINALSQIIHKAIVFGG